MIGLIFFLNYMVSKRPIYSLLCNISFIEYFLRGDISNFSFKFGETSLELEKPPVPERNNAGFRSSAVVVMLSGCHNTSHSR